MPKPRLCRCGCGETLPAGNTLVKAASIACAILIAKQATQKRERKETREAKARIKTRAQWLKEAQIAFNAYVRARAIRFGHTCISSGRPLVQGGVGGGFDCGHYRSTGSAPHLRFNLHNAWGQSKHDNQYKSGAVQAYRIGLIDRIGLEKVEALERDNGYRKFNADYLTRVAKIFRKKKRLIERWSNGQQVIARAV